MQTHTFAKLKHSQANNSQFYFFKIHYTQEHQIKQNHNLMCPQNRLSKKFNCMEYEHLENKESWKNATNEEIYLCFSLFFKKKEKTQKFILKCVEKVNYFLLEALGESYGKPVSLCAKCKYKAFLYISNIIFKTKLISTLFILNKFKMSWRNSKTYHENQGKKMAQAEQDEQYFNHDSQQNDQNQQQNENSGQQEDPLDAFMNDIDQEIENQAQTKKQIKIQLNKGKREEGFIERRQGEICEDQEYRFEYVAELVPNQQKFAEDVFSDEEHPNQWKQNHKIIEPLKPFNFDEVVLEDFEKNFYVEHEEIAAMTPQVRKKLLKEFQIKITGAQPIPKPIVSFGHLPLTERMVKVIQSEKYEHPTPIQAQALPCAFSGRDIVGIAKTGSGKTVAFVWPMILHVLNQRRSNKGEGPIALILAPTRQLCQQIFIETKKYSKKEGLKVECLLGGENKHEQWKSLKAGTDILIASPGRLIELLRKKATNLVRTTYLVLDEADRMLSMGFQQQIRSVIAQTREDRQTLLFTATMKKSMQILVGDIVNSPIRIIVGDQGSANQDVKQEVIIINEAEDKIDWLKGNMMRLIIQGKVLIFTNQKNQCEEIGTFLREELKIPTLVLHGDKTQYERTTIMNSFKQNQSVLVATDIASRGIDVKNIKTVINFECPKNIELYIHRIGRAGRAGEMGTSFTFLEKANVRFAIDLVKIFQNSGYPVPDELQDLAMLDDGFRRKRISSKMGVSFAKGKDATKYLNFALKRQKQRGNSRAGLGLQEYTKSKKTNNPQLNLSSQINQLDSIADISQIIRKKMNEQSGRQKFQGHFVLASNEQKNQQINEPTITFFNKKQHKTSKPYLLNNEK